MNQRDSYVEAIHHTHADFAISSVKPITSGQNNDVIIVNDEFIFRFPKYKSGIERLKTEVAMLKGISKCITLPIPQITFENVTTNIVGQAFIGYRLIAGESFKRETLLSIHNEQNLENLAQQLARFLRELHTVSVETAIGQQLPVFDTYEEWSNIYSRIQEKCFPYMRLDARDWVRYHFETFLHDSTHFAYKPVLKHGDFGSSNILFSSDRQEISGIIDFGDAGLGDPAYDFAGILSCYGADFLKMASTVYPEVESLWDRITFYQGTFALLEALFGLENQDKEAFESGIEDYV